MIRDHDPYEKWKDKYWTLHSDCLFERHGFEDGDLFDDLCLDSELHQVLPDKSRLLKLAVEQLLLPHIPKPLELYDANTSHNRVRAEDIWKDKIKPLKVIVTGKQIFELLNSAKHMARQSDSSTSC
ncbi:hypothetical protein [Vibrio barjaei]|uniref:hypothetical protein n=1 Tax=Vibrio barjaei TaxID=1676683 RepID=UPI002283DC0F|nr:hypothetical protein [Vibrio barjaei]MCY9870458.1 hypothetical protein [Vibrio barjaei]